MAGSGQNRATEIIGPDESRRPSAGGDALIAHRANQACQKDIFPGAGNGSNSSLAREQFSDARAKFAGHVNESTGKYTTDLQLAMGPSDRVGGKSLGDSHIGSFKLDTKPVRKAPDSNGHVHVNNFDQLPVHQVSVHNDGRITLGLHQQAKVDQMNSPSRPNNRNEGLVFGKKGLDGKITCSAHVKTETGADGNINHITLENPENLHVAGEEFQGKRVFGRELGVWVGGEAPVDKAELKLSGQNNKPEVAITYKHPNPLKGTVTDRRTISHADFKQMADWVTTARQRVDTNIASN